MRPADLVARLTAQGVTVSEQTIRVWESNAGRNPSAYNLDALARIFGSTAPLEATESRDELAAAIRMQADAITALTSEIRLAALSVLTSQQGSAELLGQLVRLAREGGLDEFVRELRAESPTGTPGQ